MKPKKCKVCGATFVPVRKIQPCCGFDCNVVLSKRYTEKMRIKKWKAEKKVLKEKVKTASDYKKDLQKIINELVRMIDTFQPCISCGTKSGQMQGGHYHSVGANASLRFNLHNIHKQCATCNNYKSGNIIGYDTGLIERYGETYWTFVKFDLKRDSVLLKYSIDDLKKFISNAKTAKKWLLEEANTTDTIFLRTKLNKMIFNK
jgi:hypothetical protein